MGRSKFRMCSIKNAKRKKAQLRSLVVSVSRHLVNLSVTPGNLCCPQDSAVSCVAAYPWIKGVHQAP